jgi:hypothetical protein
MNKAKLAISARMDINNSPIPAATAALRLDTINDQIGHFDSSTFR